MTSLTTLSVILTNQISTAVQLPHALEPLALLLAVFLTRFNHLRTRSSSSILLLFWPCYAIALFIWTRSYVQTYPVAPLVPLKWAVLFLGLLSFALECISPDDTPHSNTENPTLTANIFSIWSFAWLTPLLRKGSQVVITEDDLPALVPRDESANLGSDLQHALEKQCVRLCSHSSPSDPLPALDCGLPFSSPMAVLTSLLHSSSSSRIAWLSSNQSSCAPFYLTSPSTRKIKEQGSLLVQLPFWATPLLSSCLPHPWLRPSSCTK